MINYRAARRRCHLPHKRRTRFLSLKLIGALLLVSVAAAACLSQAFAAQSGRRTKKGAAPQPTPTAAEAATAAQADKPDDRILSLIIVGDETDAETKVAASTYPDRMAKACERRLKEGPLRVTITRAGRMSREKAVELAKREQHTHVLWFEFLTRRVGLFDQTVEHVDYLILTPRTAKTLVSGRFRIGQNRNSTIHRGGTIRIPSARTRVPRFEDQVEDGGRELADRVRGKL